MTKKYFSSLLVFLCLCASLLPFNVIWGASSAAITHSPSSVNIGDEMIVTLSFTHDTSNISKIDGYLTYDSTIIEFVPQSGINGGDGNLHIVENAVTPTDKLEVTLTFRALKAGSSKLELTAQLMDENDGTMDTVSANAIVSVKNPTVFLSSNANLASLTIPEGEGYGTLAPAFSPSITEYTVTVDYSITNFLVKAKTEDSKATIDITQNQELAVGINQRIITVTAEDGTKKKYTITIVRAEQTTSPTPDNPTQGTSTPGTTTTPSPTPTSTKTPERTQIVWDSPTVTPSNTTGNISTPTDTQAVTPTATPASTAIPAATVDELKNTMLTILIVLSVIIIIILFTVVYCMQQRDKKKRGNRGKSRKRRK